MSDVAIKDELEGMSEAEIKARLEALKHQMYVDRREGQMLRLELRTHLLRARAQEALAAGLITEGDIKNVRGKWETFKKEVATLKAADSSTKEARAECTAAWQDLRSALLAAREKAGMVAAR